MYFLFKLDAKGLPLPSFKLAVMGKRREFEIAFVALKPGMHEFTFEVDDKFFADVESRDFSNCHAFIKLHLDKKTGFMLLKFEVGGKADVECDRCGNTLTMDLWDEFNMVVKMVDNPDEMNDSMASVVGSRISACGSNGLASRQCWSVGLPRRPATSISRSQAAFRPSAYQRNVCVSSIEPCVK